MNDPFILEEEQRKVRHLEERLKKAEEAIAVMDSELNGWHNRALDGISPGEIVGVIHKEQLNSMAYYLFKAQARITELEEELASTKRELEKLRNIFRPSKEEPKKDLSEKEKAPAAPVEASKSGQRISAGEILSEEEVAGLLGMEEIHEEFKKKESRSIRDFIDLIVRLQRVKVVDASILLNVDKGLMNIWVDKLGKRKLIQVENPKDPIVVCTDGLVKVRRLMNKSS